MNSGQNSKCFNVQTGGHQCTIEWSDLILQQKKNNKRLFCPLYTLWILSFYKQGVLCTKQSAWFTFHDTTFTGSGLILRKSKMA